MPRLASSAYNQIIFGVNELVNSDIIILISQILVYIVSETSGKSKNCANQLSLAYISNKVIILVPRDEKDTLFASLPVNL